MTYNIPEFKIEELEKKLNHIAKKCKKYGNEFFYKKGDSFFKTIKVDKEKFTFLFYPIEVEGKAIINNWEFIATLEHHFSGNIIKRYNTEIEIPERFKFTQDICEHCFSNRTRTNLYIIHNTITDEYKQVGKSCLKSYTNGLSAEYVASYMQIIDLLSNDDISEYNNTYSSRKYYSANDILSYALAITNKYGYTKTSNDDFQNVTNSTKNIVSNILTNGIENTEIYFNIKLPNEKEIFTNDTAKSVNDIIDYYMNCQSESEFLHNVKVILSEKYCNIKNIGLLCYLPFGYKKAIEKAEHEKVIAETNSNYVYFGEIGKRYKDIEVKLNVLTSYDAQYGTTYIYKMEDAENHIYTWKTSNFYESDTYIAVMSIKEHKEYRGQKQTEVTRCKLERKA